MSSGAMCLGLYPEVRQLLAELLHSITAILGERFVGMYLYGSLAIGGFDPRTSDIDFLVVTSGEPSAEELAALSGMHARLHAHGSHWAQELEGSYVSTQVIRRYSPMRTMYLRIDRGESRLVREQLDIDWVIHRHVLHKQGVVLAGPPASELIDPVSPAELRQAQLDLLRTWWVPMIENPSQLHHLGYRCYAIQTMCRALYTLQFGDVVPKPVACEWAREVLDSRWAPLIDWSFILPRIEQSGNLAETRELIRHVCEQCIRSH